MLILIIAGGPDKGRLYELNDAQAIVLGREGDQVKLNDNKVSREHARLWSEGGQWYLEDLGSSHGTYRNHTALEPGQRAKIKDGDYLQVGNTVMVLGRMPADHVQRLAAVGAMQADAANKRRAGKLSRLAAGVALVAFLGLGGYLVFRLETLNQQTVSPEEFASLQQQLAEAQAAQSDRIAQSIERQTGVSRQLITRSQQLASSLNDTNQALVEHRGVVTSASELIGSRTDPILARLDDAAEKALIQQASLDRLGEMLAHQQASDNSPQLLAAVETIKTSLENEPMGDRLIAKLDQAIQTNAQATGRALQVALAEHRETVGTQAIATARDNQALYNRVLDSLAQIPTREQLASDVKLAFADRSAKNEQFMRLVLAEIRKTGDQIATDVSAAVDQDAGQARSLMQQVVAELSKRPTGAQLATDLRQAMDQAFAQRDTAQSATDADFTSLMKRVLSELDQRPTSEELAADLRQAIGADAQRTEALVARVLAELDQQPSAQQIARELALAGQPSAEQTAKLLEEVLVKIDRQQALGDQIASLQTKIEALPGRNTQAVREVLARLDQQDQNNTAMLNAIADLRKLMPEALPEQLDQILAQLAEQVRTDQITDAIEASVQRIASAQNKQTQAALDALDQKLSTLPTADQLATIADDQAALAKLLDTTDAGEALGELRATLAQLASKVDGEPDPRLKQIVEMLEKREKLELMLAELHDAVGSQSAQSAAIKRELLDAIAQSNNPESAAALRELMTAVRERLVTDESVRQAIRDEMRGSVLPRQMARIDTRDIVANDSPSGSDTSANAEVPDKRLTTLEAAYKQSFETGQPMTVGAGAVDPRTGQVSKGKRIDPSVAKALGFETWRDWYLTDRHAEQMRLQQQAIRQRNASDASSDPGTIRLPDDRDTP